MSWITKLSLIAVGLIHLLPLTGALGPTHLDRLYGIKLADPSLVILMQHRAVLFGLLGTFLIYAAFHDDLFWIGWLAGLVSVVAFLLIARSTGAYNPAIARVVTADWIALVALVVGAVMRLIR